MSNSTMTWVQTVSGRKFDLLNPQAADVDLRDIAHHLARVNRFTGAARRPLSVAEHSIRIYRHMILENQNAEGPPTYSPAQLNHALLHDAHEAYLGDITTPVANVIAQTAYNNTLIDGETAGFPEDKLQGVADTVGSAALSAINTAKARIDRAIFEAVGHTPPEGADLYAVKELDARAMITERDALMGTPPEPWDETLEKLDPLRGTFLRTWTPEIAEQEYLLCLKATGLLADAEAA